MMFSQPNILIYLTDQDIQLVNKEVSLKITFPVEVYNHQEIIDGEKFEQTIGSALSQNNLPKGDGVILLGEQMLYQKEVSAKDPDEIEEEIKNFVDRLPFDNENIEEIRFENEGKSYVVATSGHLFKSLKSTLEKNGWKINYVLPAPAVSVGKTEKLTPEDVNNLLSQAHSLKQYNFLNQLEDLQTPSKTESDDTDKPTSKWIIGGAVGIVLILIVGGYWYRVKMKTPKVVPSAKMANVTVLVTPTVTTISSPSAVLLSKSDVLISVLNGSGISGQANKIKNLLNRAGFSNISVGNYEGLSQKGTLVNYKSSVPESLRQELIDELNKSVASVSAEVTMGSGFDIVVIIGR